MKSKAAGPAFDCPEFHDLIGLVYDAVDSSDGFFPFLQRFVEVFEGHSATFSIYDLKAQAVSGFWIVNIPQHALEYYAEHVGHRDALVNAALAVAERGKSRFVASNLDLDDADAGDLDAGYKWLATYGANEAAGAIAFKDDSYLNFFGIQRSAHQPGFTREELAIFDLFLPHLNRAVGLYTKMSALSRGLTPEGLALNHIQRGILVCDGSFRVVFKNPTADKVIAANDDLELGDAGVLSFRDRRFSTRFVTGMANAVHASMQRQEMGETVLCYRRGGQNLTVVISPLAATDGSNENRGGAMLSLYDWSSRPSVSAETVRHFFDLTEAEARVSALLVEGRSPAEIADSINRSLETVRSQLKSVYRKTNTSRQSELVALLSASCNVA